MLMNVNNLIYLSNEILKIGRGKIYDSKSYER